MPVSRKCSIRSAKNKAVKSQNAVRDLYRAVWHWIDPSQFTPAVMGMSGADLDVGPDARKAGADHSVEVKARASFAVEAYMDQARLKPGEPVVFLKGDRKVMLAVVEADYLASLWHQISEAKRPRV